MEVLIEALLEILGELIVTLIANGVGTLVSTIDGDAKLKKILKLIFTYTILLLTIFLIVMSLIYSKTFLTIIAVSYMLAVLVIRLFKRLNMDNYNFKVVNITLDILRRVIRYGYLIVLIVFSSIYLTNKSAITWIIVLSSISLVLWFAIDLFKIWKRCNFKKTEIDEQNENEDWL